MKARKTLTLATIFIGLLLVGGCASTGKKFDKEKAKKIKDEVTTKEQIKKWFGDPQYTTVHRGLETYGYGHGEASSSPACMIPLVSYFVDCMSSSSEYLQIQFNKRDVVKSHSITKSSKEADI